jgi:transcriptional regulator with XRE-family HTH domain
MDQKRPVPFDSLGDPDVVAELGRRLARERLRRNLTQEALAEEAGVSRATVKRLEAGHSTQLANLIRILRALGLLANLDLLVPTLPVRPIEEVDREGRPRRRASPRRDPGDPDGSGERAEPGPWKWGEDR